MSQYNVSTKVALKAVGENLQDQTNLEVAAVGDLNFTGTGPYVTYTNLADLLGNDTSLVRNVNISELAHNVSKANEGHLNSTALQTIYEIQRKLLVESMVADGESIITADASDIVVAHWSLMPFARGSVHIRSADPREAPLIDPKYFVADLDLAIQVAVSKFSRSLLYTEPLSGIVVEEILPGLSTVPLNASDAQWANFVKRNGEHTPPIFPSATNPLPQHSQTITLSDRPQ